MCLKIFVARLAEVTTADDLYQLFYPFGQVKSVKVMIDAATGLSKRYGFVLMASRLDAQRAIAALNNMKVGERRILVKEADNKNKNV